MQKVCVSCISDLFDCLPSYSFSTRRVKSCPVFHSKYTQPILLFALAPAVEPAVSYAAAAYPTHAYSPDPTPTSAPLQEEVVSHNNGRLATAEHSVVNMIAATTNDSITISSCNLTIIIYPLIIHCIILMTYFVPSLWLWFNLHLISSLISKKDIWYKRIWFLCDSDRLWWW